MPVGLMIVRWDLGGARPTWSCPALGEMCVHMMCECILVGALVLLTYGTAVHFLIDLYFGTLNYFYDVLEVRYPDAYRSTLTDGLLS